MHKCIFCGSTTSLMSCEDNHGRASIICADCVRTIYICNVCGCFERKDFIKDVKIMVYGTGGVCRKCTEKYKNEDLTKFIYCNLCNTFHPANECLHFTQEELAYRSPISKIVVCQECYDKYAEKCDDCGKLLFKKLNLVYHPVYNDQGDIVYKCKLCLSKQHHVKCNSCCVYIKESEANYQGEDVICPHCIKNGAIKLCFVCGRVIPQEMQFLVTSTINNEHVQHGYMCVRHITHANAECHICAGSNTTRVEFKDEEMWHKFKTRIYVLTAERILEVPKFLSITLHDIINQDCDEGVDSTVTGCFHCMSTMKKYYRIKRYGYKPIPKFKKVDTAQHPNLYFGVENEVNFSTNQDPTVEVTKIGDLKEEYYYIKRDGSISNGFEIVTHPHQFEAFYQLFPFDAIFNRDMKYVTESNEPDEDYDYGDDEDDYEEPSSYFRECGMHIHMSKSAFTNAHLYKFMKFFSDNSDFIRIVAERRANGYCTTETKYNIKRKAVEKYGDDRYNQINCQNEYTVEVRCFQGVYNKYKWLKNLEFVYSLYLFTKDNRLQHINVPEYKEYLQNNKEKFNNLCRFLSI